MGEIPNSAGAPAAGVAAPSPTEVAASLAAAIIESCSEAIIPTSLDGVIIGWNSAATVLLGYTADEVVGRHWQHLVAAGHRKEIARAGRRLESGEKSVRMTPRLRRKDGIEFDALFLMSPIRNPEGQLIGFSGIFRDITEEKLAQRQLQQNQEKFKTVFKHSSDAISISSLSDGRYLDVNDEFCHLMRLHLRRSSGEPRSSWVC